MNPPNILKQIWFSGALLLAGLASAQTQFSANWVGPASGGDWNNGANWSLGLAPGSDVNGVTNATIGSGNIVGYGSPMSAASFGGLTNNGVLAVNASGFNCSSITLPLNAAGPIVYLTNGSGAVMVTGNFSFVTNGTATMIAGTSLTVGGTLGVESATSSHASGTSTFTNTGGTLNANRTTVGAASGTGTGRLVISGGVNNLGNTTVGRYASGSASTLGTEGLIINGGVVTMTNLTASGASFGTVYITGGTVTNVGNVSINCSTGARYQRVVQAGGLFVAPDPDLIYLNATTAGGETARYQVTGGTNIIGGLFLGTSNSATLATVTVTIGGVVYMGSQGIATNGVVTNTITLNAGGLFGATADWMGSCGMTINSGASPFTFQTADLNGTPHNISLSGALGGTGGLNKTGGGTLLLSAANTYSGNTLVNGGRLALDVNGSIAKSLKIIVGSGTTFDVSVVAGGFVLTNQTLSGSGVVTGAVAVAAGATIDPGSNAPALTGTLSFSNSVTETGGAINHFDLAGAPNPNNDLVIIAGDLDVSGTNTVDVAGAGLVAGTNYTLIQYGGNFNGGLTNFALSQTSVGTLTNNATAKTISFIPQATLRGPTNTVWIGNPVNTNWDNEVSTNWQVATSGSLDYFVPGDSVQFTDLGASNSPVNIVGVVQPTVVLFNSESNYIIASTSGGWIGGTANLTVTNIGTLTVLTTNSYSGVTTINGGTLQASMIANSLLSSSIGAASSDPSTLVLTNGGELEYIGAVSTSTDHGISLNGSGDAIGVASGVTLSLNGTFSGSSSLTKRDNGELRLNVDNANSGGTIVSSGTLTLASGNAAGTGGITNNNGTTLKTVGALTVPNVFDVSGTVTVDLNNTGGNTALDGAWVGSGMVNIINQQFTNRTFTMGGNGNGGGSMANFSGTIDCGTNAGSFRFNDGGGNPNTGSTNMTLDLGTGTAVFLVRNGSVTIDLGTLLGGTGTFVSGRGSGNSGTVTYSIGGKNASTIYSGVIKDGGNATALTKVGTGTLTLLGQSTYTGTTTVSNGVLALAYNPTNSSDGSIGSSAIVNVISGTFLDVSGRSDGTFQVGSSQQLRGRGTILGSLNNSSGGIIAPGGGISGNTGTLTATNSITLGGTTWMKLNRTNSPNSDQLVSSQSTITYGGTLVVTNIGPGLQVGDTFTLFSPGGSGSFSTLKLPTAYTWDTSQLTVNGSIKVTGFVTPPSISQVVWTNLANGSITIFATYPYATNYPNDTLGVNVLTSTNIALPLSSWTVNNSNPNGLFDSGPNFGGIYNPPGQLIDSSTVQPGLTITVDPTQRQLFIILQPLQ